MLAARVTKRLLRCRRACIAALGSVRCRVWGSPTHPHPPRGHPLHIPAYPCAGAYIRAHTGVPPSARPSPPVLVHAQGLGKTLQSISILGYLKENKQARGIHLVVAPLSLLGTWMSEIARWCPMLKAKRLHGPTRAAAAAEILEASKLDDPTTVFDVVVTSYEIAAKEKGVLKKLKIDMLIIDEAHRLKNETSQLSRVCREFNTQFRLLLTGTPLQNNLHELWALLNFIFPAMFKDSTQFDAMFDMKSGVAETDDISQLHALLKPFMIRRLKAEVEKRLPPKKEIKLYVGLSKLQKKFYKSILMKDMDEFNLATGKGGKSKRARVKLMNIIMQLRKACNHPYLFDGAEPEPFTNGPHLWENSGKMVLMHKLLTKLKAKKSRVLIFSQMTRMLDIMSDYCWAQGHDICRIDGSMGVDERERMLAEYTAPNSTKFIFLLSTRAGGLGLNLACADTVILYDSDWNPHADLQAVDRAHRIGQKAKVHIYRFVAEHSVDEQICERAEKKLYLDALVMKRGHLADKHKAASSEHLLSMVKFGADEVFKSEDSNITDDDIDVIIGRGEHRTEETQKKLRNECQHDLATFSMTGTQDAKPMGHDSHGFFDTMIEGHAAEKKSGAGAGGASSAMMGAMAAVDITAEQAGLTGRDAELFELIAAERDILIRIPWLGQKDTFEQKIDVLTKGSGKVDEPHEVPEGKRHPQEEHLGVAHAGWAALPAAQWRRVGNFVGKLGAHVSTVGPRTVTLTRSFEANWPSIRTCLLLLQVNEQSHLPRSSKRSATNDSAGAADGKAIIAGVGQAMHGKGNFAYMWGVVDWTDTTHTKTTKLNWPTPMYMAPSITVAKISCGLRHTVIIATTGKAFTMGHGSRSVLGHYDHSFSYTPLPVRFPARTIEPQFRDVACGQYHTALLTRTGEVWTFGAAVEGQLGRHYRLYNDEAGGETVSESEASSRKTRGEKFGARPGVVNGLKDITINQIACGPTCSFAVSNKGKVYSWGFSADGMLGLAEQATSSRTVLINRADRPTLVAKLANHNIVKVSAGLRHMLALDEVGQVYACGFGGYGRLGLKDTRDRFEPELVQTMAHIPCRDIEAGAEHCLGLSESGDVFWWGRDGQKTDGTRIPQPVEGLNGMGVVQLATGRGLSFARTSTGDVWVWGQAMNKECFGLGNNTNNLIHTPAKVSGLNNCKVVNISASDLHTVCVCDGKASSSEMCHACTEGGSLIMCDTCPLAFHYDCLPECTEPEDLPPGDWSCPQCVGLNAQKRLRQNVGKSGAFEDLVELVDHATPTEFELTINVDMKHLDQEYRIRTDARRMQVFAERGFAVRRKELATYRHTIEAQNVEKVRQEEVKKKRMRAFEEREAVVIRNSMLDVVQGCQRKQWGYMTQYHQTQEKQLRHQQQLREETVKLDLLRMQLTFDNDMKTTVGASEFPFMKEEHRSATLLQRREIEEQEKDRREQARVQWEQLGKEQQQERDKLTDVQKQAQEVFKTLTLAELKELQAKQAKLSPPKSQQPPVERMPPTHEQHAAQQAHPHQRQHHPTSIEGQRARIEHQRAQHRAQQQEEQRQQQRRAEQQRRASQHNQPHQQQQQRAAQDADHQPSQPTEVQRTVQEQQHDGAGSAMQQSEDNGTTRPDTEDAATPQVAAPAPSDAEEIKACRASAPGRPKPAVAQVSSERESADAVAPQESAEPKEEPAMAATSEVPVTVDSAIASASPDGTKRCVWGACLCRICFCQSNRGCGSARIFSAHFSSLLTVHSFDLARVACPRTRGPFLSGVVRAPFSGSQAHTLCFLFSRLYPRPFSELLDAVDMASPAEAATKNAAEPGAADAKRPRQEE